MMSTLPCRGVMHQVRRRENEKEIVIINILYFKWLESQVRDRQDVDEDGRKKNKKRQIQMH